MSQLQDVCAALEAIDEEILQMAGQLHGKAQAYGQAAQRAAAIARAAAGDGGPALARAAAALDAAARHCAQAAAALAGASREGQAYVRRTAAGAGPPPAQGTSSPLSDDDRAVIGDYTRPDNHGPGSYSSLNGTISSGSLAQVQEIAARSNALSAALGKLPGHRGLVYRGASGNLSAAELDRYEPGAIVTEPRYTSSTLDPEQEFSRYGGNAIWVIESQRGHVLGDLADPAVRQEAEVLFDRFARFQVLAKEYSDELHAWVIYLEEVS